MTPRTRPARRKLSVMTAACLLASGVAVSAFDPKEALLVKVVNAHLEANGGAEKMLEVNSLKMSGKWHQKEGSYPFTFFKQRPDKGRLIVRLNDRRLDVGFDGEQVWRRRMASGFPAQVVDLTGEESREFVNYVHFDGPLLRYLDLGGGRGHRHLRFRSGAEVQLLGQESFEGRPCHEILVRAGDGSEVRVFIDKENYRELGRVRVGTGEDGKERKVVTYLRDHRRVKTLWLPHEVETQVNGELESRMEVDDVKPNRGVPRTYFQKPRS